MMTMKRKKVCLVNIIINVSLFLKITHYIVSIYSKYQALNTIGAEKELLRGILVSLEIPRDKLANLLCLVDMGFSACQVALAITEKNTSEVEDLLNELTKDPKGKGKEG